MAELSKEEQVLLSELLQDPETRNELNTEFAKEGLELDEMGQLVPMQEEPEQESRMIEAGLEGAGQSATFGYLPEIKAGVTTGFGMLDDYDETKQDYEEYGQGLKEQHPTAHGIGTVAGAIALPGGAALKGATMGAKALRGSLIGAGYGAGQKTQAEASGQSALSGDALLERLQNAGIGAAFGVAGEGVSKGLELIPKAFAKSKNYLALKTAGAKTGALKKIAKRQGLEDDLVDFLDTEGLLKPGKNFSDIADYTEDVINQTGDDIGRIYKEATEMATPDGGPIRIASDEVNDIVMRMDDVTDSQKIMGDFMNDPKLADEFLGMEGGREAINGLKSTLSNFSDLGPRPTIQQMFKHRKSVDKALRQAYKDPAASDARKQALMAWRRHLDKRLDSAIDIAGEMGDKMAGKGMASSGHLKSLKARYAKAKQLNEISSEAVIRENAKSPVGLMELGAGGVAAGAVGSGQDPLAVGGGLLGMLLARKYGPGLAYSAGKHSAKLSKGLGKGSRKVLQPKMTVAPWASMQRDYEREQ
jgi:hypothetical protein